MKKRILSAALCALTVLSLLLGMIPSAVCEQSQTILSTPEKPLRREISPSSPVWIVHIDTWNNADPDKIIDLIPEDIRPYVVCNISLSVNWSEDEKRFKVVEYGYETAKSWLRTCAERGVWTLIQPASGGPCHLPDYDPAETDYEDTVFAEFFRDYPNFLGFNYCEQFWGFEQEDFPITPAGRYKHFAGLLELCHKYGGYLVDSWCGNQWGQWLNPLAMIKNIPEFEEAARLYSENFILLEKYTQTGYIDDVESLVLGTYLSGYCGNFGVRYDETGWTDESGQGTGGYTVSTGLPVHFERLILNGATVIDGPELVPEDDFYEAETVVTKDGYSQRTWAYYNQFYNVMIDLFRKTLDGTFRIPEREEVIERTKVIIVNDIESGNDDVKYCTPASLFEGLYKMEGDGNLRDNHTFYKSTGRYPTFPETAGFADPELESKFEKVILKSEYNDLWPDVDTKVADMNEMFPEMYTGDIYAAQKDNVWVTYNPYKRSQTASGTIPLLYNTCESVSLEYPRYSSGIIRETSDGLSVYLNNYEEDNTFNLKRDVITVTGAATEPTYEYKDRSINSMASKVSSEWSGGVWKLTVEHNGPIQLEISCSGTSSGKPEIPVPAEYTVPEPPIEYTGPRQYEAELFETKDINSLVRNGASDNIRNYTGQGYIDLGSEKGASARDTVRAYEPGTYLMTLKYSSLGDVSGLGIYVNGGKKSQPALEKTEGLSKWKTVEIPIKLKKGENEVELRLTDELSERLYIDNFTIVLTEKGSSVNLPLIIAIVAIIAVVVVIAALLLKKKSAKKS